MVKKVSQRYLAAMLVLLMVFTLMPFSANAAVVNGLDDLSIGLNNSGGTWGAAGTLVTGEVTGSPKAGCSDAKSATSTLTITNKKSVEALLSFNYELSLSGGSAKVNGNAVTANGVFSETVGANQTIQIEITSAVGAYTTKITLKNITLIVEANITTTFKPSTGGSFTVDGAAITETTSLERMSTDAYSLVATPANGMKFAGWYNETKNEYPSAASPWSARFDEPYTITALFVPSSAPVFDVAKHFFTDLNEAVSYANSSGSNKITLISNGTLPAGTYTIPSGKTLLIPCDEKQTVRTSETEVRYASQVKPTAYKELTMANGANLVVANGGIVSLAGDISGYGTLNSSYNGTPTGPSGWINMNSGSTITVQSGGALYAYGYIYGSGTVDVKSNGTVLECFQIRNWRGGSVTTSLGLTQRAKRVFPFSQYYVQNIEVPLTLEAGAREETYSSVNMSGGSVPANVPFIGAGGMFEISSGSITKKYIAAEDRLEIEVNGNLSISPIEVDVGTAINSANFVLPITNNITVNVNSGTTTVKQSLAFLPGTEMNIANGATVNVNSGIDVYVYDQTEWNAGNFATTDKKLNPISFSVANQKNVIRTDSSLIDARIDVNGTVNVNGALYTTASGAEIISSEGTGVINLYAKAGTATVTYQCDGNSTTLAEVPISAAKLKNGDGSFYETAGKPAGTEIPYSAAADKWAATALPVTVKFDGNGADGSMADQTVMPGDSFTFPANGFTVPEGHTFAGWTTSLTGDQVIPAGTPYQLPAELPVTEITLTAQWTPIPYTITFKNEDGTVLQSGEVAYGTVPTYTGETPVKDATAEYTYSFSGWDKEVVAVTGDATYTATFTKTTNKYTVKFLNEDGTVISENEVAYGTVPTVPTAAKENTAQYTYTFAGWNNGSETLTEIPAVTGEVTYQAVFTETLNKYLVKFVDEDGTVLQSGEVEYGTTPTAPADPSKDATEEFTYTFAGWDKEIVAVTGDATYTATYAAEKNKYTVKFVDDDGTELSSELVEYGTVPTAPADPTKAATAEYTYTFSGWDKEIAAVTGDATYTATYAAEKNKYTVSFLNEDGTEAKPAESLDYGTEITAPADPTKENTPEKVYTFLGWFTEDDVRLAAGTTVTGDVTYQARFGEADQFYTVIWLDANGNELKKAENVLYNAIPAYDGETPVKEADAQYTYTFADDWEQTLDAETFTYTLTPKFNSTLQQYTVTFVIDGEEHPVPYVYGDRPAYEGTPEKPADAQYTYTFKQWNPAIETVTGDATYTAEFKSTLNSYTVTWVIDGVEETETYLYGAVPAHADPVKDRDAQHVYVFTGWDKEIEAVTGDVTYTAQFDAVLDGWQQDDAGLTYYVMGELQKTGLTTIDGQVYYLDEETGYAKTGWFQNGDGLYDWMFFDETTGAAETGSVTHHETINYFGEDTAFDIGYTFDETTHKLVAGTWVQYGANYRLRWANYFPTKTWIEQEGEEYYLNPSGFALRGVQPAPTPDGALNGLYVFDETTGAKLDRILGDDVFYTVEGTDRTYYLKNDLVNYSGLIEHDGAFYYVQSKDFTLVKNQEYKITKTNGLKPVGSYVFDAEGRMLDGIVSIDGQLYYFRDGVKSYEGLYVEYYDADGNQLPSADGAVKAVYYYFTSRTFEAVKGKTYYVTKNNDLLPKGYYPFDENGQYVVELKKDGIVEEDGQLYFYENGKKTYAGLVAEYYDANGNKLSGPDGAAKIVYYYFTSRTFEAVKGQSYYITKTNDLLPKGTYTFDENGQYVVVINRNGFVEENGQLYYYENGQKSYAGLVLGDDGYYYYFTSRTFEAVKGKTYYITKTNDLLPKGTYTFDENGRLVP